MDFHKEKNKLHFKHFLYDVYKDLLVKYDHEKQLQLTSVNTKNIIQRLNDKIFLSSKGDISKWNNLIDIHMPQYISKESFYEEYQNQIKNQIKNQSIPFYLQNGTDDNLCFHSSFPKSLKNVFENYIEKDMTSYDYNYDTTFMNIFSLSSNKKDTFEYHMYVQSISNEINDEVKKHEKVKQKEEKK